MSLVIAHRGACHFAPENTVPAFQKAVEIGVDGIETDVQLTKDHRLVIHHNYDISGTGGQVGRIAEMTLDELKALDFGSHKGAEFAGTPIATLDECLDTVRELKFINLELKAPFDRSFPFVENVISAVRARGLADRVVLSAFDHSLLAEAKRIDPAIKVGALTMPAMDGANLFGFDVEPVADIPLSELSSEHPAVRRIAFPKEGIDVVAKDPVDAFMELIYAISALFPGRTMREARVQIERTQDLCSYVHSLDFTLDYVHPHFSTVLRDPGLVRRIGIPVNPYTPDDPAHMRALINAGCYGLITNRPDLLAELQREERA